MPWGNQIFRNLTELNPVYDKFSELIPARSEIVRDMSVFDTVEGGPWGEMGGDLTTDARFAKYMYSDFDADKLRRLGEFRTMSMYAPVADCLDEIADEMLFDDSGMYAKLEFHGIGDKEIQNELSREFEMFLDIFELKTKGWDMVRQFMVEGEVFFENVINADHPEYGIVGLVRIPTELCVPIYENVQNSRLKNFLVKRPVYAGGGPRRPDCLPQGADNLHQLGPVLLRHELRPPLHREGEAGLQAAVHDGGLHPHLPHG